MRVVLDTNDIVSGMNSPGNEHLVLIWPAGDGLSCTYRTSF